MVPHYAERRKTLCSVGNFLTVSSSLLFFFLSAVVMFLYRGHHGAIAPLGGKVLPHKEREGRGAFERGRGHLVR